MTIFLLAALFLLFCAVVGRLERKLRHERERLAAVAETVEICSAELQTSHGSWMLGMLYVVRKVRGALLA